MKNGKGQLSFYTVSRKFTSIKWYSISDSMCVSFCNIQIFTYFLKYDPLWHYIVLISCKTLKCQSMTTLFSTKHYFRKILLSENSFQKRNMCPENILFWKLVSTKENKDLGNLLDHWIWWSVLSEHRNLIMDWISTTFSYFELDRSYFVGA